MLFRDARPVKNLFDYLRVGRTIADFLVDFPGVTHQQVESVLERATGFFAPRGRAA